MNYTITSLMKDANCNKWPERWNEIFDVAMNEFDTKGLPLLNAKYYINLNKKYGILSKYLDLYVKAAEEVKNNEALSRLLMLLVVAMRDRENIYKDLENFTPPASPSGEPSLGYDLLCGLSITSVADYCYEKLKKLNIPEDMIYKIMIIPEGGVTECIKRTNGVPGYHHIGWNQLAIDGNLFRINRLEIEINSKFRADAVVFKNSKGDIKALAKDIKLHRSGFVLGAKTYEDETDSRYADITETETCWQGYPYNKDGSVDNQIISLDKNEWSILVKKDDPVVDLHIPPDGPLSPGIINETIEDVKAFLAKYLPDYKYKAFFCSSWLCNPELIKMLGEDANISRFTSRFMPFTAKTDGLGVFYFVFLLPKIGALPGVDFSLDDLPENTTLYKALKQYYKSGKVLNEMHGLFI